MGTKGKIESKIAKMVPTPLRFLSRSSYKTLWLTEKTNFTFEKGKVYLCYVVSSNDNKDYTMHKKLKIYKGCSGYYVYCKGIRCYCGSIIPKWMKEII